MSEPIPSAAEKHEKLDLEGRDQEFGPNWKEHFPRNELGSNIHSGQASAVEKPLKHKRDVILEFHSSPDAILNALHQAGWQIIPRHSGQAVDAEQCACGHPLNDHNWFEWHADCCRCQCKKFQTETGQAVDRQQHPEFGHDLAPITTVVDRQEWTQRTLNESLDQIWCGDTYLGCCERSEATKLVTAHNAALAAERKRREELEELRTLTLERYLTNEQKRTRDQLLSALAAIEKHNKRLEGIRIARGGDLVIQLDLSLLRQHDAEVLKPLVYLLELAWGIIANAGGGEWERESKEWQDAACRWRDNYHTALAKVKEKP